MPRHSFPIAPFTWTTTSSTNASVWDRSALQRAFDALQANEVPIVDAPTAPGTNTQVNSSGLGVDTQLELTTNGEHSATPKRKKTHAKPPTGFRKWIKTLEAA